jgi:iron complex outermembrane receptor protein
MDNANKPTYQPNPDRVPPFGRDSQAATESDTWGGTFRLTWNPGAVSWSVGGDFYRLHQNADRSIYRRDTGMLINYTLIWPDAEMDNVGLYGQAMLSRQGYQVGGTVRVDYVDATAGEVSDYFLEHVGGDLDQTETNVSAAASATFDLSPAARLTVGLGRAVRSATAIERYSDRFPASRFQVSAEFVGDPTLNPETSLEFDVGVTTDHKRVEFATDLFYRVIDDYITMVEDPDLDPQMGSSLDTVFRYVNGDQARYYGGEARILHRFARDWQWRGTVSYTWAEDTQFDEPVFGIAPLQGELTLRYGHASVRPWWVETGAWIVARQDRVATSRHEVETPGYTLLALRGQVDLGKGVALRAGVENLTDKTYADHLNSFNPFTGERINEIGRQVYLGASLDF